MKLDYSLERKFMKNNLKTMLIVFLGVFFTSLMTNTLSPFITTIKSTYNMSSSVIAMLPSVVYCGSFIICLISAKLMDKSGLKKGTIFGAILAIIASIVILASKSYTILLIGYFFTGLASGMITVYVSTILSLLPKKYQKFSLFNACYGIGGILILPIDRLILENAIPFNFTYIIHIITMIIFIILVLKMDNINIPHKDNRESIISVVKNPFVLFTSIAIFLYVGSELSTTNWTGTFLESHYHISKADVPNILMGFWILFTFGRAVGDILLEKIGQLKFLMISPIITLLGIFILITGKNSFQALVGIAIIGMTISIIYPALQSYIVQNVKKENIPPVTIIISLFNCTGATVLTYAVGFAVSINISYVYLIQVFFYLYIIMLAIKLLFFNKKRYDI